MNKLIRVFLVSWSIVMIAPLWAGDNNTCGAQWQWQNPKPHGLSMRDVVWSAAQRQFVVVGESGLIVISTDGVTTYPVDSGVNDNLNDILWTGSQYFVVGNNGVILSSSDAQNWEQATLQSSQDFNAIAFSGSRYIAVGSYSGEYALSDDGVNWQIRQMNLSGVENIRDIVWANNRFTAIANGGYILTSSDGLTWQASRLDDPEITDQTELNSIAVNGSQYIVVGSYWNENTLQITRLLARSSDGTHWTTQIESGAIKGYLKVFYNGAQYIIIANDHVFYLSEDGANWQEARNELEDELYALAWDGHQYMGVGANGMLANSANGTSWQQNSSGDTNSLYMVRYLNHQYLAGGAYGSVLFYSDDGQNWKNFILFDSENRESPITDQFWADIVDIAASDDAYVLLRVNDPEPDNTPHTSALDYSTELHYWKNQAMLENTYLTAIVNNGEVFVAVGKDETQNQSVVYTSSDGKNWQKQLLPGSGLNHVIWKNRRFIAVGNQGTILSSTDGSNWQNVSFDTASDLLGVDAGESLYVAAGKNGMILSSSDGQTWTQRFAQFTGEISAVLWNQSQFTLVGGERNEPGYSLTSSDGTNWQVHQIAANFLTDIAWNAQQQLITTGFGGNILSSECYSDINFQNTRAIIVAGGGDEADPLWPAINYNANYAYRVLRKMGISREHIRYLNHKTDQDVDGDGDRSNDVYAAASSDTLQQAITGWAVDQTNAYAPLLVYLIDHGGDSRFYIQKPQDAVADVLTPQTLSSWLDTLQEKTGTRVSLLYDACNSGSFMQSLAPPQDKSYQRVNIFSAKPEQVAYFGSQGQISFSAFFWSSIAQGYNVYKAFRRAQTAMRSSTQNGSEAFQSAIFDDNGDGAYDSQQDGDLAQATYLGIDAVTATSFPQILANSTQGDIQVSGGQTVSLYARANLPPELVSRVWVMINPPDAIQTGDVPVTDTPMVDLSYNPSTQNYEAQIIINDRYQSGQYTLSYFARDNQGLVSQGGSVNFMSVSIEGDLPSCVTQAATLDSHSLILYINQMAFASQYYNLALKYIMGSNPPQFTLQYYNQIENQDFCNQNKAAFADGVLTIPSILFDNSAIIKQTRFRLNNSGAIELIDIAQ